MQIYSSEIKKPRKQVTTITIIIIPNDNKINNNNKNNKLFVKLNILAIKCKDEHSTQVFLHFC